MSSAFRFSRFSSVIQRVRNVKDVMFNKYLLFTNMGISFGLSATGDILQQHYMLVKGEKNHWDKKRTYHMSICGLSVGFVCHHWYLYLDKKLPGRALKIVLSKILIDQLIFSPVYISVFFLTSGLLEAAPLDRIGRELIRKGRQLYVAEWVVWTPAQFINFTFLPSKYRVLYDNTISLGCDIYTSYVKHESE